ncbi:pyrimidine dimer DNA glycosylase/endonuclease V [Aromatoleum sp.]|uniref:pyrimidine dimer DNA glycosylase/endonuclease V n=1 Tax=Aromatoleum sp. TaxID=2307007 RepID=UPI002FC9E628
MRLWSLHPKYLDPQGLVALWREALLARAVLRGETKGYRNHPQLERFRSQADPVSAIGAYLAAVYSEAVARGYSFDRSKIGSVDAGVQLPVTDGQIAYEWRHLLHKLATRNPALYEQWRSCDEPECHPLFVVRPGQIEPWERPLDASGARPAK